MQTVQNTETIRRKRRMLLLMPLLVIPFIILFCWALGAGKSNTTNARNVSLNGLNTQLPDANLKSDQNFNKLSFYQQASKDSVKLMDEKRNDPYWLQFNNKQDSSIASPQLHMSANSDELYNPLPSKVNDMDENEANVYSKLDQLNKALANSRRSNTINGIVPDKYAAVNTTANDDRVKQLEVMMNHLQESKTADPEITQLNQMLDKIAAIQHPESVKDNLLQTGAEQSKDKHALSVYKKSKEALVSTLQVSPNTVNTARAIQNAFYGESSSLVIPDTADANAFSAAIAETQTIVNGATVKLSLSQEVTVQNKTIQAGNYLYGMAALRNDRLTIHVNSIRIGNSILPVSLTVYDMDGQEGIYVPGSISINAVKQSAGRITSSFGASPFAPSIGAQAANAGIETAKVLLSKKVNLVRITLPAGYQVLIKSSQFN